MSKYCQSGYNPKLAKYYKEIRDFIGRVYEDEELTDEDAVKLLAVVL